MSAQFSATTEQKNISDSHLPFFPAKLSDPIRVGIRIWTRRNSDTLGGITLAFLLTFPIAFAFYKSLHFRPVFRPEFRPAIGRKWCQFRLVQTRIQRRIPAQKTHQLLLDSAKGRKGCKIPSSSDSDSEVDSDPKDAPIIKRTEMVRIQLRNQILKGTSTIWGDGIDAGFSYGIKSWKQ